jgi:N-sulfoglucosamine sulfohydrolase
VIACGPGVRKGVRSKALANLVDVMPTVLDYAGLEPPKPVHGVSWRPVLEGRPGAVLREIVVGEVQFGRGAGAMQARGASDGRLHYIRRRNPGAKHVLPADGTDLKPWGNRAYEATLGAKETHPEAYRLLKDWEDAAPAEELFDLEKDPWCTKDIAKDPAYAAGLARMRQALDRWIEATGDTAMKAGTR